MSKASDLLPPIRLLATVQEAVGKTVKAISNDHHSAYMRLIVFEDDTALYLDSCLDEGGDWHLCEKTGPDIMAMASALHHCRLIGDQQYRAIYAAWEAERSEQRDAEERVEYERLKAKFEGGDE